MATRNLPAGRPRGRPPMSIAAQQQVRDRILDATRTVFTRVGYHGLSVELVIAEAGLSRPTFYKYFRSTDEPIEQVIQDANDRLINSLMAAVAGSTDTFAAVEAGLIAWRRWGEDLGPMLRPLFAELHDPHSPASRHRRRTLDILSAEIALLEQRLGRQPATRLQVETLLNGIEYVGYRYHLETPRDPASWKATRDAMLRLAIAMLGNEQEWSAAVPLAHAFNIDLAPGEPDHPAR